MYYFKNLYIFFIILSLNIFFFSTANLNAKAFLIEDIEISEPFKNSFDKNSLINKGFENAFFKLINSLVKSSDIKMINKVKLNEIKSMIESFSIKEEKFINQIYYVNLGVSFDKRKIFNFLEKKNIFPTIPKDKQLLFIPIIIDENKKDLLLFSNNKIFNEWNNFVKSFHLIEYILPTEDLEDLNLIKNKYEYLEKYDFKEIINKYNLKDSIIALIFKNDKEVRVLSRITISDNVVLKNQSFSNTDVENTEQINNIIKDLKIVYEDFWKNFNQINTSIKLTLNIKINSLDNFKLSSFEKILKETDLIYDYFITKFDNNFTYYQIIFNGTPNNFLKTMSYNNYNFNTQNKIWELE